MEGDDSRWVRPAAMGFTEFKEVKKQEWYIYYLNLCILMSGLIYVYCKFYNTMKWMVDLPT